ncbi:hypothetical protein [Aquidulcibacter sp.]|uniref:hypothetical protein n=1 Tax=Aquidulcibacter sp. TaxID=2052990 RepID=UPI0028B0D4EC|nr:hypothetical protein [Aquidulcibacter sp.]
MLLDKFPKTLLLDAGTPRILDYLGTVVPRDDTAGRPGNNCGAGGEPVLTHHSFYAPTAADAGGDIEREVTDRYTLKRTSGAQAKVDLVAAIELAGVPPVVTEQLEAAVDTAVERLDSASVTAVGTFRQYQIKPELIRAFNDGVFSDAIIRATLQPGATSEEVAAHRNRLQVCRAQLLGPSRNARMYQAITGIHVHSYRADQSTVTTVTAQLAARVKALKPDVNVANLQSSLDSVATTVTNTTNKPLFVVVGVSFYSPQIMN